MYKVKNNVSELAIVLMFVGLFAFVIYNFLSAIDFFHYVVRSDDYRLTVYHLMPFYEGGWTFNMLWSDDHPNPLHGLILICSALYDNLSFSFLPYVVFPFMVIKWWAYCKAFRLYNDYAPTDKYIVLGTYCFFGFIVFSIDFSGQYFWNSVAIANIYHAIGAVYLAILLAVFKTQTKIGFILLTLFAFCFHIIARQYSGPWVIASIIVLILYGLANYRRREETLKYIKLIAALCASLLLEQFFYATIDIELNYNSSSQALIGSINQNWWHRKFELVLFLMGEFASPLVQSHTLTDKLHIPVWMTVGAIVIVNILILLTTIICLINRNDSRYFIPLIMIVFVSITILAGLAHRTDMSTDWLIGHWPRYNVFRNVSIVAVIWVASNQILISGKSKRLGKTMMGSILSIFLLTQISSFFYHKASLPYKRLAQQERSQQLKHTYEKIRIDPKVGLSEIVSSYEGTYKKPFKLNLGTPAANQQTWKFRVIKFWGENELNVFSEKFETR